MQKSINFLSLIVMLCFLSSASCEKEPVEPDGPDKLIVGTWVRTQFEFLNAKTNGVWVLWSIPCEMDDTEEFTSDGKWIYNAGANLCSGQTIVTGGGTYRLEDNGAKVILIGRNGETPKDIETIDDQSLVLIHDMKDVDNSQIRTTYVRR